MFLGHWLTLCSYVFVKHSTSNSKKPVVHSLPFLLLLFALLLAPPSPTHPSILRNPVTSPLQTYTFVYIQAPISLFWCSCSCTLCFSGNSQWTVIADSLKSDFTGAVWISGAKGLLPRLCVILFFYMKRHKLAVLLCILLKRLRSWEGFLLHFLITVPCILLLKGRLKYRILKNPMVTVQLQMLKFRRNCCGSCC